MYVTFFKYPNMHYLLYPTFSGQDIELEHVTDQESHVEIHSILSPCASSLIIILSNFLPSTLHHVCNYVIEFLPEQKGKKCWVLSISKSDGCM